MAALKRRFVGGLERTRVEARRCEEEGELLSAEHERCFERNVRPVFSEAFRRASADVRALEGRVGRDCRRALRAARYSLRTQGLASPFGDLRSAERECRREADASALWAAPVPAPASFGGSGGGRDDGVAGIGKTTVRSAVTAPPHGHGRSAPARGTPRA